MNLILHVRESRNGPCVLKIRTENLVLAPGSATGTVDSRAGNFIRITVMAGGATSEKSGMPEKFEPLPSTGTDNPQSLGLFVINDIAQDCNGWVTHSSEKSCVSAFSVYLPALPAEPDGNDVSRPCTALMIIKKPGPTADEREITRLKKKFLSSTIIRIHGS
jgi:nitrogen-specific signal transduction histidine kinase